MKYRIIEDSTGDFRVQFKGWFMWHWLRDWSYPRNWIKIFLTKELALEEIKELKKLDNYKIKVKVHKVNEELQNE